MAKGGARTAKTDGSWIRSAAPVVLGAFAIFLAWQILVAFAVQRLPVELSLRVAPTSPAALSKGAEAELLAERVENARWLSEQALARAPFDVRALRVRGLVEARLGNDDRADEILTLAGNWSLRDDPAHAWLIAHRLQRGDYHSAFAHADTLARRRTTAQAAVFKLFTEASATDPRGLAAVVRLLERRPPWRPAFLRELARTPRGLLLTGNLAIAMKGRPGAFTAQEIGDLYQALASAEQYPLLREVRARLSLRQPLLADPDFAAETYGPFGWTLEPRAGATTEMLKPGPDGQRSALLVKHDGFSTERLAYQLTILAAGRYRLSGQTWVETGRADSLRWTLVCANGSGSLAEGYATSASPGVWTPWSVEFDVPQGCPAQQLWLVPDAGLERDPQVLWFRGLTVRAE
jgi:hypothetical protein